MAGADTRADYAGLFLCVQDEAKALPVLLSRADGRIYCYSAHSKKKANWYDIKIDMIRGTKQGKERFLSGLNKTGCVLPTLSTSPVWFIPKDAAGGCHPTEILLPVQPDASQVV